MNKLLNATCLLIVGISVQAKQPNILFFYADDWAKKLMSVREATKDPRLTDVFDHMPWVNPDFGKKSKK